MTAGRMLALLTTLPVHLLSGLSFQLCASPVFTWRLVPPPSLTGFPSSPQHTLQNRPGGRLAEQVLQVEVARKSFTCRRQSNSTPNQKKKHGRAAEQRSAVPCGKSEQRSDPQPLALLVWNVPCRIAYVCSIPPTCQMGLSVCDPLAQAMERCRCLSKHAGLTKLIAVKPCRVDCSPGCIQAWKSGAIVRLTRATPLGFCWYSVGSNVTAGCTLEPFWLSPEFRSSWWRLQTRDSVPAWVC